MQINNEAYLRKILDSIKEMDYIRPEEIPNIDLYMDQVTTFMDEHLKAFKRYPEDKLLTKTMINNYTKNELLPSPNKKKYSKEHMLLLIFIYYFKNILSISDIKNIFEPLTGKYYDGEDGISLEDVYSGVFELEAEQIASLTKDIIRKYQKAEETFPEEENEEDRKFLQLFSFICMLSFDVYMKKVIIENIIDNFLTEEKDTKKKKPDK